MEVRYYENSITKRRKHSQSTLRKEQKLCYCNLEDRKIINTEEISAVDFAHQHQGLADLLVSHGVTVVITGGIGQGAIVGLQNNKLQVIKGASGDYNKVVEEYINGTLKDKNVVCNHHGEHHHH